MEFINEKTIRLFDKDMIAGLEKIIEANRPKIQEFLGLAVRGGLVTGEMLNKVEQNCRANLFGIAFFMLNAIFQTKKFHEAHWVFVALPPRTYTKGNIFYDTVVNVIAFVVKRSGMSLPLRPWVNGNESNFHTGDGIHLSDAGFS